MDIDQSFLEAERALRKRYETISIVNDLLIAVWFLVGSVLFFSDSTTYVGTWLFVLGSAQLLARPTIRLVRKSHLERHRRAVRGTEGHHFAPTESDQDF